MARFPARLKGRARHFDEYHREIAQPRLPTRSRETPRAARRPLVRQAELRVQSLVGFFLPIWPDGTPLRP